MKLSTPCVILAGGKGTRISGIHSQTPKSLIPIAGIPFVDRQLTLLSRQGITDILLLLGHLGESIQNFVGDGSRWNIKISTAHEVNSLLGTAGALRNALDQGKLPSHFFLLYGDSYLPISFAPIEDKFLTVGKLGLMTVYQNKNKILKSNVSISGDRVIGYDKAADEYEYIDYGLSILSRNAVERHVKPGQTTDLGMLFQKMISENELTCFEVKERFYEIGSEEGIRELTQYLESSP